MKLGTWTALVAIAATAVGCGDDTGIAVGEAPLMEVSENGQLIGHRTPVSVTADRTKRITVNNRGNGTLEIRDISVTSDPPGAFSLDASSLPTVGSPVTVDPDGIPWEFEALYMPAAGQNARGTVTITTNKNTDGNSEFIFYLSPETASPKLLAQPGSIDFGTVAENSTDTEQLTLLNTGTAQLVIDALVLSGHPGYQLSVSGQEFVVGPDTAQGVTLPAPIVIEAGESLTAAITYSSSGPEPAEGKLVLMSNDPSATAGTQVEFFANVAGPCINVSPAEVDFGGKLVGQESVISVEIQSCGDRPLSISNIEFINDGNGVFGLDASGMGAFPIVVAPNDTRVLPVSYFPEGVAQIDASGNIAFDTGLFRVTSDAYLAEFDVEVQGYGTDGACPTSSIQVTEGEEVLPQTNLTLRGSGSASTGNISGWEWTVEQPVGSQSIFLPSAYVQNPTFEANIVGEYTFKLRTFDAQGTPSCEDAEFTVFVTSDKAIHVELLWTTPGDIDETDTTPLGALASVGTDLDLHFLHPSGANFDANFDFVNDGWFHDTYDAYWANVNPEWAGLAPGDNPSLDRDDTDGAGPENLNLDVPEFNKNYRVGVHYWEDHGFGNSIATVRVYVWGNLQFEWAGVQLTNHDMWDVCEIQWPGGAVNKLEHSPGQPFITSGYWPLLF